MGESGCCVTGQGFLSDLKGQPMQRVPHPFKGRNMTLQCICEGNLRQIVSEVEGLIGKKFKNDYDQEIYTFFGIVIGDDDYYYGMYRHNGADKNSKMRLLSCVGNLETHGYELQTGNQTNRL